MMRLAEIEAHIAGTGELLDIVGALRSLAGMRMQEAYRALPGIRRYAETMATAIGDALLMLPKLAAAGWPSRGRRALVVCTAEHGFVGGFNARIIDAALAARDCGCELFVLGSRGAALACERGWRPAWAHRMATRPEGAPETVRRLGGEIYRAIARGQITNVEVMFARQRQGGAATIERRQLIPIDFASFRSRRAMSAPLHNLAPEVLLERLVAGYVLALLTEAAVESLASENSARFAAMSAAHDNTAKRLEELRQEAHEARQTEITEELLDLVTGAKAVEPRGPPVPSFSSVRNLANKII